MTLNVASAARSVKAHLNGDAVLIDPGRCPQARFALGYCLSGILPLNSSGEILRSKTRPTHVGCYVRNGRLVDLANRLLGSPQQTIHFADMLVLDGGVLLHLQN